MQPTKPSLSPVARPSVRVTPPYSTGKVSIGLLYVPVQPWTPSRDAYNLQTALLSRSVGRGPVASRLFGFLRNFV